jgi:hypothetical protein
MSIRTTVAAFVVLACAGLGVGAGPASAHSSTSIVRLAVTADRGMTVVSASLVYANDHQPVRDEFVLAEVTGNGGTRSFQLRPDERVPGHFASPAHLAAGRWTLRVSANAATVGFATGEFTVGDAGQLTGIALSSSFDPDAVSKRSGARSSTASRTGLLVIGAVFLVALMALVAKVRATGAAARERKLANPGLVR